MGWTEWGILAVGLILGGLCTAAVLVTWHRRTDAPPDEGIGEREDEES